MSGDGSSTVSRELWKTMLMVRNTNTRRIRAPMLKKDQQTSQVSERWSQALMCECSIIKSRDILYFVLCHTPLQSHTRMHMKTQQHVCMCVSKQVPRH